MWLLFTSTARTRVVAGGESFVQKCPSCKARSRFVEIEVEESVGVFFVDVVGTKERAFRCGACAQMFEHKAAAPPVEKSLAQLLAEDDLQQAVVRQAAQERAERIEDELADLKRRAGR